MLVQLPLQTLTLWSGNVRRRPETPAEHEELKASIKAHGLLENLIVCPCEGGGHSVISGGRRLKALQSLAEEGHIPHGHMVDCKVSDLQDTTDNSLTEISLAENVVRVAMHPLDEFEAFSKLANDGLTCEQIATRYGKSARSVQQRLKLGRVHEDIRAAYGQDVITQDCLMAFTLTSDTEEQLRVFHDLGGSPRAWRVRDVLTEGAVAGSSKVARFVGLDAYRAAGGRVTEDLFSDDDTCFLEDRALVEKLANERLEQIATDYKAEKGWAWVSYKQEGDYEFLSSCRRLIPTQRPLTPQEQEKLDEIEAQIQQLEEIDAQQDGFDEDQDRAYIRLSDRCKEIEKGLESWTDEQLASGGALIVIGYNSEPMIYEGLVLPEDQIKETQEGISGANPLEKPFSKALRDDLITERLAVTQAHLAQDFGCAFDLMLVSMIKSVASVYSWDKPLDIQCNTTIASSGTTAVTLDVPEELTEAGGWPNGSPEGEYTTVCSWDQETKQRIFAYCAALTLKRSGQCRDFDMAEAAKARLGVDMATHWRPTKDGFWKRISKDKALEIAEDVLGHEWVKSHRDDKKAALAVALADIFSGKTRPGVSPEQATAASCWLPDVMRQDTLHLDQ